MRRLIALLLTVAGMAACGGTSAEPGPDAPASRAAASREPVVGLPCEGCDAVFDGMPDSLGSSATIAGPEEPGERMVIEGIVKTTDGRAAAGVIVYAYHTDDRGIYPRGGSAREAWGQRHGRLRAWVRSDADGRYRFDTIRPAGYPETDIPAHVHMHVIEPGRCTYYIDDIHFEDDHRLTAAHRRQLDRGRGGSGFVRPTREGAGPWRVTRDIVLGTGIPGYPETSGGKSRNDHGKSG